MIDSSRGLRILAPTLLAAALAAVPAASAGCAEEGATPPAAAPAPAAPAPTPAPRAAQDAPDAAPTPPETRPAEPTAERRAAAAAAEAVAAYATLLADVVTESGLVRYDLIADPARTALLDEVVRGIAAAPLPETRAARLALWCNAYNANALAEAFRESREPGFESVAKVPGFFDRRPITVAGERLTLNDLENERIRPLGDPRIHAALVCAAMSCPPLRAEPYDAARLDEQLDDQCVRWVNDAAKFRMVDGRLGMSEILKWYGEDFDRPPYGSAVGFVLAFARPGSAISRYVVNTERPRVEWLTYDWSLNRAPARSDAGNGS